MEIEELVNRAKQGDKQALESVCRLKERFVYEIVLWFVKKHHDAEDVVQEVLSRVCKNLVKAQPNNFDAWLWKIAVRAALAHIAKIKKIPFCTIEGADQVPSREEAPEVQQILNERIELVRKTLDRLPARGKEAIQLRYFQGLDNKESADKMAVSPVNLRQITHRALGKFKQLYPEPETNEQP